jgi:AraC-like DNA-binding protein
MPNLSESKQSTVPLGGGTVWIYGDLSLPAIGTGTNKGALVMGSRWMLEMVRFRNSRRTIGLFLAAYGIVNFEVSEFAAGGSASFVGVSIPGKPPAPWLRESILVDLGRMPIAASPADLLAAFEKPMPSRSLEAVRDMSPLARKTRRRIGETYKEDIPISKIAEELGVSHAHLTRQFKREVGFTPLNYRHQLRISDATGRLMQGDDILEVGHDVGFNDTSRFYHDFRKITGVPPGKCRR